MKPATILTVKLLKQLNACADGIEFAERNKLIGFPLDKIDDIVGNLSFLRWIKRHKNIEVDSNGNVIYYETSTGYWEKQEYDTNSNLIYLENSIGYWKRREYDSNGNVRYVEESGGFWTKYEYDSNGNMLYREGSTGDIRKQTIEYYPNGQLKSMVNALNNEIIVEIPPIEQ